MRRINQSHILLLLLGLFTILLTWSAFAPKDYTLWMLEAAPAIIGVGLCIYFYFRIPFSTGTYIWCLIAACIMLIGAHYSYSEVPHFDFLKTTFNSQRNNFDKVGHFVQGLVSVRISQEVLIRKQLVSSPHLINFLSFCVAMAVAAVYEMIEWVAILLSPDVTENFLGMQGYIWDAQSDMFVACIGALCAILFPLILKCCQRK